ncbi:MAG: site-specific integrase [Deltaproteobacteria bacterium]|nr:MAG: site-specific integrase [Deltaproteobacteria bacterium]
MANIEKRTTQEGAITYRAKVRLKGHPPQSATFQRITDARKWVQNVESAIREGRHFKTSQSKRHTLAELIDRYLNDVLSRRPKTKAHQEAYFLWWKEQIGRYLLADITPALIVEQRDKLANGLTHKKIQRAPGTVNRYLAALSYAFTVAVREWGWVEENPFRKVSKLKEPRGRVRYLSDIERGNLLESCKNSRNQTLYLIVVLALSTGARKNEILSLTWDNVDFSRKVITLRETKNGEIRLLPLASHALDLMLDHSKVRRIDTNLVFPGLNPQQPLDMRTAWESAVEAAEIKDFKFHDLRHSAASYLAMNGASLAEIAEVLGHKTLAMVKRYSHLSEAHTAKIVTRMNERIFG